MTALPPNRKAIFLDRDGVINKEVDYLYKIKDFVFTKGCIEALRLFQLEGYLIFIITNQAGIGRGLYSEADFHTLNNWMLNKLKNNNVKVDAVRFCPHHAQHGLGAYKRDCNNRKPKPGMINSLVLKYNIDISQSILVGDKLSDIEAGVAAKIKTLVLVKSGKEIPKRIPNTVKFLCENLAEFSQIIFSSPKLYL